MKNSSALLLAALSFGLGFAARDGCSDTPSYDPGQTRIVVLRDTVKIVAPTPVSQRIDEGVTAVLRRAHEGSTPTPQSIGDDSVGVVVPIVQNVYEGADYKAYVSGWQPRLDSLVLNRVETRVTLPSPTRREPPRFSAGLQAGYGITPRGFQPYIGIGVAIRIL